MNAPENFLSQVAREARHDYYEHRPSLDQDRPSRAEAEADAREDARHAAAFKEKTNGL